MQKKQNENKQLFRQQSKKNFEKFFDKSVINKISKASGFVQRKPQKINPFNFVLGFIFCCLKKKNTYEAWAIQIGLLGGKSITRQSVFDRLTSRTEEFAKQLLQQILIKCSTHHFSESLFSNFGKVLLQDSTTLRLPQVLAKLFPGNSSRGEQKAIARIQSIFNVKAMQFIDFTLSSFTQNDQSASGSILSLVHKGDLIIRDLGYFAIATFEKLIKKEVYFLSRLKYGVKLSDKQGNVISMKSLMKTGKTVDRWVFIGSEKKVWVRLVMIPLPAAQAAEKRRKARHDRDKRLNHSREYYQLLGYNVFITTVDTEIWTATDVARAYKTRWQIEIIFKSWKSGFHLQNLLHDQCTNEYRVRVCIYLMLLFICLFMQKIYINYKQGIEKQTKGSISLLKLADFISTNILEIFMCSISKIKEQIVRHCCYDKRSDRMNMADLLQTFKN